MIKSNTQYLIESVEIAEDKAVECWHVRLALELNRLRNDLKFGACSYVEGVKRLEALLYREHDANKPLFQRGEKQ